MANAVAPDEVNDEQHEQRAANQHGNGDLQPNLKVAEIGDFPHNGGAKPANQLRGKHVNSHRGSMRAARHHVVKDSGDWTVIPGHEEERDGEADEHG